MRGKFFALLFLSTYTLFPVSARCESDSKFRLSVADPFPKDSVLDIQKRLNLYKRAGIGMLRIDIGWRAQEATEGSWTEIPIIDFLMLAKENGFYFKANIGAMSGPPSWLFKKFPDAQMVNQDGLRSSNVISYWYPGLHALLEAKDDELFASLAKANILARLAYVVVPMGPGGEPLYPVPWTTSEPKGLMRFWYFDSNAQADFPKKMQAKYGGIASANSAWGTHYANWAQLKTPAPGTQRGALWQDVLLWYRDTKRDFVNWQLAHYQTLIRKYYPDGNAPKLIVLVPGTHVTVLDNEEALRSGDGNDGEKMMADSEYLLDAAHKANAFVQYTGLPNMVELEYLKAYMRRNKYSLPLWGENAGNKGDPEEMDEEVLANDLYGQEYIGSNLFAEDHVTTTQKFADLVKAHAWLSAMWAGTAHSVVTFKDLPIKQGTCIVGNLEASLTFCMQDDANLVLRKNGNVLWASETSHAEPDFCTSKEDPVNMCNADFQGDGNFVIRRGGQTLWSSNTGKRGRYIVIKSEFPYVEIRDEADQIIWNITSTKRK